MNKGNRSNISIPVKMKTADKKSKVRKVLVRNAVTPVRTRPVSEPQKHVRFARQECKEMKEEERMLVSETKKNDLSSPQLCTVLKLADEIRKVKLEPDAILNRRSGKNSRPCNVDYEPGEKLFNDLITLDRPSSELRPSVKATSSFRSLCKKDPEPDYKELLKYSLQPEYNFTRLFIPEVKKPVPQFDGRSIYRLTKRLECYDPEVL